MGMQNISIAGKPVGMLRDLTKTFLGMRMLRIVTTGRIDHNAGGCSAAIAIPRAFDIDISGAAEGSLIYGSVLRIVGRAGGDGVLQISYIRPTVLDVCMLNQLAGAQRRMAMLRRGTDNTLLRVRRVRSKRAGQLG